jgi:hypothetical protein
VRARVLTLVCSEADASYSISLLCSLSEPQGIWVSDARVESNSGLDFLEVLITLVDEGHLVRGDILVS